MDKASKFGRHARADIDNGEDEDMTAALVTMLSLGSNCRAEFPPELGRALRSPRFPAFVGWRTREFARHRACI